VDHFPSGASTYLLWVLVAVLTLLWIAIPFLPPPTSLLIAEVRNLVSFSLILAAFFWLDRLRSVRGNPQSVKIAGD
jgi:hypothetical protein